MPAHATATAASAWLARAALSTLLILAGASIGAQAAPVRIVAIGASNTHGWYVGNAGAYPAQLQALLRAEESRVVGEDGSIRADHDKRGEERHTAPQDLDALPREARLPEHDLVREPEVDARAAPVRLGDPRPQIVPEDLRDLMRSLQATRWQTLKNLEFPAALPVFLGGLRIGATLAVIGAVVGEFVGAKSGLGFLVNVGRGVYDTALVFVAVFTLVTLALGLYGAVVFIESRWLSWRSA